MSILSGLTKLKITAYADENFEQQVGEPFSVSINPEKYSHTYKICYTDPRAQGSPGAKPRFNKVAAETVTFEIVFDATGVIQPALTTVLPPADGIAKDIDRFKNVVFAYYGKKHSPKFLTLVWGRLLFRCRLTSLDLNYTLFKPDGAALRATASASFIGYSDEEELAKAANKNSPDLTHLIEVKAGDTLPLLCWNVYGSSARYLEVARVNGLTGFRELVPGTRLVFPPVTEAPAA